MRIKKKLAAIFLIALTVISVPVEISATTTTTTTGNTTEGSTSTTNPLFNSYSGMIWYDEGSDSFIYQTRDVRRVSGTFYHTLGLELSRIKADVNPYETTYNNDIFNPLTADDPHYYVDASTTSLNSGWTYNGMQREYVIIPLEAIEEKYEVTQTNSSGNTVIISSYVIPRTQIFEEIGRHYPDWLAELNTKIENSENIYIGVDCYITMCRNQFDSSGKPIYKGSFNTILERFIGEIYDWSNWDDLQNMGWRTEETRTQSIPSHFNVYLSMGENIENNQENDEAEDNTTATSSTCILVKNKYTGDSNVEAGNASGQSGDNYAAPDIRTYNDDEEFDIGTAIPTTEDYENTLKVDSWYGHANITKRDVTKTYAVPYGIAVTTTHTGVTTGYAWADSDMSGLTVGDTSYVRAVLVDGGRYMMETRTVFTWTTTTTYTGSVEYAMPIETYYCVTGLNLLSYAGSTVDNDFSHVAYNESADIQYNVTINGERKASAEGTYFGGTSFTPNDDYHIIWPDITGYMVEGTFPDSQLSNNQDAVQQYVREQFENYISAQPVYVRNDTLQLDNVTYMTENGLNFSFVRNAQVDMTATENDIFKDSSGSLPSETVVIPKETANGHYYTTLRAMYRRFAAGSRVDTRTMVLVDDASNIDAILQGYEANEPIVVHSPAISPIQIRGEEKTQLVSRTDETQLILDNTYTAKFDWNTFFRFKGYTNVAGFTSYIDNKQVSFPFSVEVNGTYYEPNTETGYTDWIDLGIVEEFDFYVPSWAGEGVYGAEGYAAQEDGIGGIKIRVFANNASAVNNMEEYTYNSSLSNYVATYEYPVEISGVLYDFTVVSVNDDRIFGDGSTDSNPYLGMWNFSSYGCERKVGTTNRFGETNVRYAKDGSLHNTWNIMDIDMYATGYTDNASRVFTWTSDMGTPSSRYVIQTTLPFTSGKVDYPDESGFLMGFLQPGHTIGFTVKTIANLDGTDDTIKITPHYRYVSPDGDVIEDIEVYYSTTTDVFIKAGSETDTVKNIKSVELDGLDAPTGGKYFRDCFYDYGDYDTVSYTADVYGKDYNSILYHATDSYCFAGATLYSTQKLLTGNEEELYVNRNNSAEDALRYQETGGLGDINNTVYNKFRNSMQTWYGQYCIPGQLYVCKTYPAGSEYADQFEEKVAVDGFVSEDDDFWLDDGYLILSFDITTYKDGTEAHLSYYKGENGNGLNMWQTESINDCKTLQFRDCFEVDGINLYDGDVAVITLDTFRWENYSVGWLYLN